MTVPTSSLIAMGAAAAFCALLPIGILIWWRRTERTRLLPALWGALAFLLFARGLEMGLHYLCILSDNAVSRAILSSPWLYMLYGSAETAQTVAASLGKYTVGYCLLACLERVSAMLLHISLSVFVFAAARSRARRGYLAFAIGLHAIFDMPAALYQFGYVKQLFPVELWLAVCALYALRSARKCYLEECDA